MVEVSSPCCCWECVFGVLAQDLKLEALLGKLDHELSPHCLVWVQPVTDRIRRDNQSIYKKRQGNNKFIDIQEQGKWLQYIDPYFSAQLEDNSLLYNFFLWINLFSISVSLSLICSSLHFHLNHFHSNSLSALVILAQNCTSCYTKLLRRPFLTEDQKQKSVNFRLANQITLKSMYLL